jgi:hypothetical protein
MPEIQHGTVTVVIPDEFALPAQAGNMSPDDVRRIAKAPRGLGLVCDSAADVLEKSPTKFTAPAGVTPATLRAKGRRAEGIDQVILDLEVVMNKLKQANLLFDADAYDEVRKTNDQVKAQGKRDPEVMVMFKPVVDFFARARPGAAPTTPEAPAK